MEYGGGRLRGDEDRKTLAVVCAAERAPVLLPRCCPSHADPLDAWSVSSYPIDPPAELSAFQVASAVLVDCADPALGVAECVRLVPLALPIAVVTSNELSSRAKERAGIQTVFTPSFRAEEIARFLSLAVSPAYPESRVERVSSANIAIHARVRLDRARRTVIVHGCETVLSFQKFELLCYLVDRAGTAVAATELVKHGLLRPSQAQRLKGLVQELRARLGPAGELIRPVPGYGYRFDFQAQPDGAGVAHGALSA